jgi:hypothetical protein
MAIRLAKAFGSSSETWLRLQMAHDLAEARKREPAERHNSPPRSPYRGTLTNGGGVIRPQPLRAASARPAVSAMAIVLTWARCAG